MHKNVAINNCFDEQFRQSIGRCTVICCGLLLAACSSQPVVFTQTESWALNDTVDTPLGREVARFSELATPHSGVYPLYSGLDAFDARSDLIKKAAASIDIQVFLYHDDVVGNLLGKRLLDAADRGVRVRILLDDFHSKAVVPPMVAVTRHPNIEVRLFNPFSHQGSRGLELISDFSRLNRRMHNKSFIVDNQIAIVGGRNIGDEYFDASADVAFLDSDLICTGPIVSVISTAFDRYWNSSQAVPAEAFENEIDIISLADLYEEAQLAAAASANTPYGRAASANIVAELLDGKRQWIAAPVELLFDEPEPDQDPDGGMVMAPILASLQSAATEDLLILSPYFVPQQPFVDSVSALIERGVRVRIITNSLASTNQTAVHTGYKRYRKQLLSAGAEIYELVPWANFDDFAASNQTVNTTLHSKVIVVDTRRMFIGSFNQDPRSAKINTEMGLLVSSPELAMQYVGRVDEILESITYRVTLAKEGGLEWRYSGNGQAIVKNREPETSWWRRTKVWFLGLLPIEDQL
jgi:putative cardiolipin synthase